MRLLLATLLRAAGVCVLLPGAVHAQEGTEIVRGRVLGPDGQPVPGAIVTITGAVTQAARLLRTDYKTLHLKMKEYRINVRAVQGARFRVSPRVTLWRPRHGLRAMALAAAPDFSPPDLASSARPVLGQAARARARALPDAKHHRGGRRRPRQGGSCKRKYPKTTIKREARTPC